MSNCTSLKRLWPRRPAGEYASLTHTRLWIALLIPLALAAGCATPRATLVDPTCRRVTRGDQAEALAFTATIQTQGLLGEQCIYEVTLHDAAGRPIRSRSGHYQNKDGAVAASRTFVVLQSPRTYEAFPLAIPTDELPPEQRSRPLSAKFRLYSTAGEALAEASCDVPGEAFAAARRGADRARSRSAAIARRPGASVPPRRTGRTTPAQVLRGSAIPRQRPRPGEITPSARTATRIPRLLGGFDWLRPQLKEWTSALTPAEGELRTRPAPLPVPDRIPLPPLPAVTTRPAPSAEPIATPARSPDEAQSPDTTDVAAAASLATAEPAPPPATQPAPEERRPRLARYVVQKGDSLSAIAFRLLGDAGRWKEIYDLNQDQLDSPDIIIEGMVLRVPAESPPGNAE
jgi:hypothetical protein